MLIKLGVAGNPTICSKIEESIPWLGEHGLHEEIEFVRNVWMTEKRAEKVAELAKKHNVELSIHAPYYINLANPEKAEISKKRILACCKIAEILNAGPVVFHAGYYGKDPQKARSLIKKECLDLSNKTRAFLGLETTGRVNQFGTLDEILEICEEINNCVPVVDFAHIYARSFGKVDFKEILRKLTKYEKIHSHFSGIEIGKSGERKHTPIDNNPCFKEIAKMLLEINKPKEIMIINESPLLETDALKMKKILEEI
ncbi:MAG: TIM barrel protein [archaeon]